MLEKLDRATRLKLLRVVAAAAWVDGEVQDSEREFVRKLLDRLPIDATERATALGYLDKPPHPAEADPSKIAPDHREALMNLIHQVVLADGHVSDEEREALRDLDELLLG